jgi:hypothetical protein
LFAERNVWKREEPPAPPAEEEDEEDMMTEGNVAAVARGSSFVLSCVSCAAEL